MRKLNCYYGYWLVIVAFFCVFIYAAYGIYIFSLFAKPLQTTFGWTRSEMMLANTICTLTTGLTAFYIGKLISRYGIRIIVSIGAFILGFGMMLLSQVNSLWLCYIGYFIVGLGCAAIGTVPATTLIANWFSKRRGTMMGIMSTGIGVGGLVLAPFVGSFLIPKIGWQLSYIALGSLAWLLIPFTLLLIRTKPADMGLLQDGEKVINSATSLSQNSQEEKYGVSFNKALRTSSLWLIAFSFLLFGISQSGVMQNQVLHLQDIGFPVTVASSAIGFMGLGSIFGKLGFGWLCDRIHPKYACSISIIFQIIAVVILMNIDQLSSPILIWLYAILMGLGIGGWLPSLSILTSKNFGLTSYSMIIGMIFLVFSIGNSIGPVFGGYLYDITQTYHWFFVIVLILFAASIITILISRRPNQDR